MVCRIVIENFFSVADSQEINLRIPANAPELPCFRASRSLPDQRLPMIVGFYGPNASGKSTILRAITNVAFFVRSSFSFVPNAALYALFNPYARNNWWVLPTKIIIDFDGQLEPNSPPSLFRYELHISHEPNTFGKDVAFESLSYSPHGKFRRIFERNGQRFDFGKEFGITNSDSRIQSIRPNASVISTLAQLNHKVSSDIILGLQGLQTNVLGLDKAQNGLGQALSYYLQNPNYHLRLNQELSPAQQPHSNILGWIVILYWHRNQRELAGS
jgi:hypothetical protein